jgi:phosphoadenosine phosphosulfate reductase
MWRWVDPPERMRKLCGTVREKPIKVSIDGTISVSELDYERFINLSRTSRSTMKVLKDRLILSEDPIEALRILVRANLCTGCGVCLEYCERKAIKLSEKASVGDSCDRCGLCNEVCPLSSYFMKLIDIS